MSLFVGPWAALRRVLLAPGFVLALWLAQVATAKLFASPARAAAEVAMRRWIYLADGHLLRAMTELLQLNPSVGATIGLSLLTATIFGLGFWVVLAPALLARLAGERSGTWLLIACARHLPAMLVQTAYSLVLRAVCLALAGYGLLELGAGWAPVAALLAVFPALVLDRARAAVVLDGQRPFHPMTFLAAVAHLARRPLWWLLGTLAQGLKLGTAIGALLLVIAAGPSPAAIWVARAAGLATLLAGLWRVSLAVEDHAGAARSPAAQG